MICKNRQMLPMQKMTNQLDVTDARAERCKSYKSVESKLQRNCKCLLYWMYIKLFTMDGNTYLYPYANRILANHGKHKT